MALQGYGIYRMNSIKHQDRCMDLDHDDNKVYPQAQNHSGRQLWIFNPIPATQTTWDIRFAGNAAAYLTPGDNNNGWFDLVTKRGGQPTYWHTLEASTGQYYIFIDSASYIGYYDFNPTAKIGIEQNRVPPGPGYLWAIEYDRVA